MYWRSSFICSISLKFRFSKNSSEIKFVSTVLLISVNYVSERRCQFIIFILTCVSIFSLILLYTACLNQGQVMRNSPKSISQLFIEFLIPSAMLWNRDRATHIQSKCSTTEPHPCRFPLICLGSGGDWVTLEVLRDHSQQCYGTGSEEAKLQASHTQNRCSVY